MQQFNHPCCTSLGHLGSFLQRKGKLGPPFSNG